MAPQHQRRRDRWDVAAKSGFRVGDMFEKQRGEKRGLSFDVLNSLLKNMCFLFVCFSFLAVYVLHSIFWRIKQINQDIKDSQGIFDCLESS